MCGACTVHMDDQPMRSCALPVSAATGEIMTIEAVAGNEAKAVQAAWVAHDVPQCGYCQSGQIMTAVALLREQPKPTDHDIEPPVLQHGEQRVAIVGHEGDGKRRLFARNDSDRLGH